LVCFYFAVRVSDEFLTLSVETERVSIGAKIVISIFEADILPALRVSTVAKAVISIFEADMFPAVRVSTVAKAVINSPH
jgi:hypothetical protein